jgi:hypothetical protein
MLVTIQVSSSVPVLLVIPAVGVVMILGDDTMEALEAVQPFVPVNDNGISAREH